jgi:competence protein ComEC
MTPDPSTARRPPGKAPAAPPVGEQIPVFVGRRDVRMATGMVDLALLVGVSLVAGGIVAICPIPTSVAAVVSLCLLRRRISRLGYAVSLGALAMSALSAGRAVAEHDRTRAEVRSALGGPVRCFAEGRVASSPVLMHGAATLVPASTEEPELVAGWDADLTHLECEGRAVDSTFRARLYGGPDDLRRGDRVEVIGKLAPLQLFHNEDLGDPRPGAIRRGTLASGGTEDVRVVGRAWVPTAMIDRLRSRVRRRIEATFVAEAAPMARALVLGESDLDAADNQAFRASGLAHLLAVSGTHLVLVVAGAVAACTALLRRMTALSARWDVGRISAALGVVFSWIYADFAGGSGSARRAAAMLSFALAARVFGRRPDGPRAFGLSLVGAGLFDPLIAFDLSFLLSAAATAGLMVLQAPLATAIAGALAALPRFFRRATADRAPSPSPSSAALSRVVTALSAAVATTLAATIGCAPLIAFLAPTLPIGGVPANLLAVPLGELLALPLCLGHVLLSPFPSIERGDALVASGSLLLVRTIARATERISWLAVPVPPPSAWQCAILWCGAIAVGWGARQWRVATALGVCALLFALRIRSPASGGAGGKAARHRVRHRARRRVARRSSRRSRVPRRCGRDGGKSRRYGTSRHRSGAPRSAAGVAGGRRPFPSAPGSFRRSGLGARTDPSRRVLGQRTRRKRGRRPRLRVALDDASGARRHGRATRVALRKSS